MMLIGLNGFGRIGRNFLRAMIVDKNIRDRMAVAAINIGPMRIEYAAHLFKYDTLLGTFSGDVNIAGNTLIIDDHVINIITELDPASIPWKKYDITWVVEATGRFTHRADALKHCIAGARKVLITAPAHDDDGSFVMGVNQHAYDEKKDTIVSMGSCTTNAVMPVIKVVNETFSIVSGAITTVHAYTSSQMLLDNEGEDLRRSRAAAVNIIPTSTGADSMIQKIFPALKGTIISSALRVPVPKVSFIDCAFIVEKSVTLAQLQDAFVSAQKGSLKTFLTVVKEPLVSSDFAGSSYSVSIDEALLAVSHSLVKVCGWYDNEWAYSVRLKDFLSFVSGLNV